MAADDAGLEVLKVSFLAVIWAALAGVGSKTIKLLTSTDIIKSTEVARLLNDLFRGSFFLNTVCISDQTGLLLSIL